MKTNLDDPLFDEIMATLIKQGTAGILVDYDEKGDIYLKPVKDIYEKVVNDD